MDVCPTGFAAIPLSPRLDMVPIGGIIAWSGAADAVPAGYQLCDGTNLTPDLRDTFIMGAGPGAEVGETGGSECHTHNSGASVQIEAGAGPYVWTNVVSGITSSMPPFHALAYIQRMA